MQQVGVCHGAGRPGRRVEEVQERLKRTQTRPSLRILSSYHVLSFVHFDIS